MPRNLPLKQHHDTDELYRRYRKAKDPVERTHWQIIWLKSQGEATKKIAALTGYTAVWVRQVIHRYNKMGAEGLIDQRKMNPGAKPLLDEEGQADLAEALKGSAPDGGNWNSRKVADWIAKRIGRDKVHTQRGWDYMQRLSRKPGRAKAS